MAEAPLLDGIVVLDLSSVGPASRASRMLADYGARVVKVGPTAKKGAVQIRPPFHSYGAGRDFERFQVDLKAPEGKDAFLRLAAKADVLIESYRPGVTARLGIGWEDVRKVNERIVYCSTTGYGQDGPYSAWAGHDINYLAVGGYLACSTEAANGGPPLPGATVADAAGGGMHAVLAILAALVHRATTGRGRYLDVAATEGVLSLMSLSIDQFLATGEVAGPRQTLLTGRYACYDVYRTRDDRWLSVGAIEPHFWANLCKLLGLEQYAALQNDDARQDEIRDAFQKVFAQRDRDEWVAMLAPRDTCVAPVYTIPELTKDPHLEARRIFMEAEERRHGRFRQVAPLLAGGLRGRPLHHVRSPDETDTDRLLREAEVGDADIARLRAAGAVE
jgi:alpha-methylacyl-CoA racemase